MTAQPRRTAAALQDNLAARHEAFSREISQLVAQVGSTGNRFSTALLHEMEVHARDELTLRAEMIRDNGVARISMNHLTSEEVRELGPEALSVLCEERRRIESTVNAVDMGRLSRSTGFLQEAHDRAQSMLQAELVPLRPKSGHLLDEAEPSFSFFGLRVSLTPFLKRLRAWKRRS